MKSKITFVGSGNVAGHLAKAFDLAGFQIHQIVSRNVDSGKQLAKKFAAYFSIHTDGILEDSDFIFLTIPDSAIESTIQKITTNSPIFMHCAGSCSLDMIAKYKPSSAVFYPLQTFTKDRPVNFFKVPVFVEAKEIAVIRSVTALAETISNNVVQLNSEKRSYLHLAAVMANNFTNHLLGEAGKVLEREQMPLSWLKPLMEETVNKAFDLNPSHSQTGPAIRKDDVTINKHLQMLENDPKLKELYSILSKHISDKASESTKTSSDQ